MSKSEKKKESLKILSKKIDKQLNKLYRFQVNSVLDGTVDGDVLSQFKKATDELDRLKNSIQSRIQIRR